MRRFRVGRQWVSMPVNGRGVAGERTVGTRSRRQAWAERCCRGGCLPPNAAPVDGAFDGIEQWREGKVSCDGAERLERSAAAGATACPGRCCGGSCGRFAHRVEPVVDGLGEVQVMHDERGVRAMMHDRAV